MGIRSDLESALVLWWPHDVRGQSLICVWPGGPLSNRRQSRPMERGIRRRVVWLRDRPLVADALFGGALLAADLVLDPWGPEGGKVDTWRGWGRRRGRFFGAWAQRGVAVG